MNFSNHKVDENVIESANRIINFDNLQLDERNLQNDVSGKEDYPLIQESKIDDSKNESDEIVMREQLSKMDNVATLPSDRFSIFASTKGTFKLEEEEEGLYDNRILLNNNNAKKENRAESKSDLSYTDRDLIQAAAVIEAESKNLSKSKKNGTNAQLNTALEEIKSINKQSFKQELQEELPNITTDVNMISE